MLQRYVVLGVGDGQAALPDRLGEKTWVVGLSGRGGGPPEVQGEPVLVGPLPTVDENGVGVLEVGVGTQE